MKSVFLACAIFLLAGMLFAQPTYTFHMNAFDVLLYDSDDPFPNDSDMDLHALILFNGAPLDPPIFTPYLFGAPGNLPFSVGVYGVYLEGWENWFPDSITFDFITTDYEIDFLGQQVSPNVELSYFAAELLADNRVQLNWVTESEINLLGYRVYRNTSNNQAGATMITPNLIPATNTSQQQSYYFTDEEPVAGNTNFYWLEAIGSEYNSFHGPVSVYVPGTATNDPGIPAGQESSGIRNAWPNPFRENDSTHIKLSIKSGEAATLRIYNLYGQALKTYELGSGPQELSWDGKDSRGNACGSGVYLLKFISPSMQQIRKLVIIK